MITKVQLSFNGNEYSYSYETTDDSGVGCIREIVTQNDYKLNRFSNLENKTILDIGANHGLATIILAKQNPNSKVYCFEPNSKLYEIILVNIKDNELQNVVAYNKAVNSNKSLFLIENAKVSGASTVGYDKTQMENFYRNYGISQVEIECISIDEFLSEEKIDNIFLMKIDCEGSEFDILTKSELLFKDIKIENIVGEFHDLSYFYDKQISSAELLTKCKQNITGIVDISILRI